MRIVKHLLMAILLSVVGGCGAGATAARGNETTPKTGEELLDRVEATLRGLPGASVDVDGSAVVQAPGVDNKMESSYAVRFERPRRWAIEMTSGTMGGASVSNGEELTTYFSMTKRYTVQPVPADWDPAKASESAESLEWRVAELARRLMGYDLKSLVMAFVSSSEVKDDELDGKPCWLGEFKAGDSTYKVWVSAGEQPLIQRIVAGSGVVTKANPADEQEMTVTTTVTIDFKNWNTAPKFTDADFAFTPPEGAEQGDSLLEGMGGEPEIHPLVGQPAPEFELETLAGEPFKLGGALKKQVIMLDFWATWCGPCVAALPQVAAAAAATKDKGVLFYAVNLQESPEQIKSFLEEHKLDVPVLLDKEGAIAQQYQVSGIPQTVLIGKDGRVQVVHVGFGGDAKGLLIKQLTALAEGKDLAGEAIKQRKEKEKARAERNQEAEKPHGLTEAWSHDGAFSGVAVDAKSGDVYALKDRGPIVRFDASGKQLGEIPVKAAGKSLRLAQLDADPAPEFLSYTSWMGDLTALNDDGEQLWFYPGLQGIDDAWPADLDGDGVDETIVGYNGGSGLHVVDGHGKERWKNASIGNVWHVAAGRFTSADAMQVVCTSATGDVHVFSADGESVKDLNCNLYANGVRLTPTVEGEQAQAIVAGAADNQEIALRSMTGANRKNWQTPLPSLETPHVDSLTIDAAGKHAVVGMRGGLVQIVELAEGKIIAGVGGQGTSPDAAMVSRERDKPLAVVATGKALTAFTVEGK